MLLDVPYAGRLIINSFAAVAAYEYIIARTKSIDSICEKALAKRFDQIIPLGAGYDTRALRFREIAGLTRILELDSPATQQAKIE